MTVFLGFAATLDASLVFVSSILRSLVLQTDLNFFLSPLFLLVLEFIEVPELGV